MRRSRSSPVIPARRLVQVAFLLLVSVMGAQFTLWAFAHIAGREPAVGRPAGVEGFLPISALMSLRLALAVGLAVGMYVGMAAAFGANGYWHGSVSEGEYARRLQEIDSPLYTHVGGMAAAETRRDGAALVPAHGSR
jgi:hypothetical protein